MKRIKLFVTGLCILITHLSINADQNCKNGACAFDPHKTVVSKQEEKSQQNAAVIELTSENFESVTKKSTKPVIVDFYAIWCQPCKLMKPFFAELAETQKDYIFASIEGDKYPTITAQCNVSAFPSFVIFKDGVQWGKIEGGRSKEDLLTAIKKIVASPEPEKASQTELLMQLLMAINERNVEAIKKSIANGVGINETFETPLGSISPLSVAVISGTNEIIDLLLASGAKMDSAREESIKKQIEASQVRTEALQKSFDYCKNKISGLSAPVKQRGTMNGPEVGMQFLQACANPEQLKKLIEQGADVNTVFQVGKSQSTPICIAMIFNNTSTMDMLIEAGAVLSTEIITEKGHKQTVQEALQEEIETYKQGIIKSRERLAYAVNKKK
jgi:thioredoxin 1